MASFLLRCSSKNSWITKSNKDMLRGLFITHKLEGQLSVRKYFTETLLTLQSEKADKWMVILETQRQLVGATKVFNKSGNSPVLALSLSRNTTFSYLN